tara:strand:- start:178 stop:456 length:279 start_codon:yes stop_codon:yes gene_type:complete
LIFKEDRERRKKRDERLRVVVIVGRNIPECFLDSLHQHLLSRRYIYIYPSCLYYLKISRYILERERERGLQTYSNLFTLIAARRGGMWMDPM